nr:hypothetical protein [Clostridioides difficile]
MCIRDRDRTKFYDASEALTLVSDIAGAKFDETVEALSLIHISEPTRPY